MPIPTSTLSLVVELLPELIDQYPGAWRIVDRHGIELFASENIAEIQHGIWRQWTRPLSEGRSVTWFIRDV